MKPGRDRALVVEDSRTIAAIVKHYLQLEGFEVLLAADGEAGLAAARREQPDLVVADLNLPGMGGLDLVKALRADKSTERISIFMLTSDASPESEKIARSLGADDYIVKPVQPQDLAARARAIMDRAEKSRQWVN